MKGRVYWSKYLYDKGITKNVIYSGAAVYSPYYESKIMALYAEKIGIQKENIFIDTLAQHSTENVYYSYKKARSLGFERIAVASDPFQTKMLKRFTRKVVSPDVGLIPFVADTLLAMQHEMIDPEIDYQKAFVRDFTSLPHRKNFFERFKGTEGKDIDKTAYDK
jgi:5-formaminoimidazole-4-carboxamide-1-beta-D-ribofuranosyl 5'-monophosphate synthetase